MALPLEHASFHYVDPCRALGTTSVDVHSKNSEPVDVQGGIEVLRLHAYGSPHRSRHVLAPVV